MFNRDSVMGNILEDLFGTNIFDWKPNQTSEPKSTCAKDSIPKLDYLPVDPETIHQIIHMYAEGVAVSDIENFFGMDVNKVIDHFSPYL